ncbi:MAG: hypothetical protein HYW28_05435, partial [Rhodospirillales bacterium]|nr:hypothetical protein [Rhodospirillales bacterium]
PGLAVAAAPEEKLELKSLDGTALTARLFKPEGRGPFAAVVMLHGCGGMVNAEDVLGSRPRAWADIFTGLGWVVLMPDSFTARGHGSLCKVKDRPVLPNRERPYDAYGALKWLQAQPYVRADKVVLVGWSNGAMTLLWTLKDDAKARPQDLAHDFVAGVGFYPGCISVRKTAYKPKVPMLLQVGLADGRCRSRAWRWSRRRTAAAAPGWRSTPTRTRCTASTVRTRSRAPSPLATAPTNPARRR